MKSVVGLVVLAALAVLDPRLLLYLGIPIFVIAMLVNTARDKLSARQTETWIRERETGLRVDPEKVHREAIERYVKAKRVNRLQRASPLLPLSQRDQLFSSHPAFRSILLRQLRDYVSRFPEVRTEAFKHGMLGLPSATEMKSVFDRTIAADRHLDSSQAASLSRLASSELAEYLKEEADSLARSEKMREASEAEEARKAKALQSRSEREQGLLKVRLGDIYSSPWNTVDGRLSLEDALKADLSKKNCVVYRLVVGGESYVGYTADTVIAASNRLASEARRGGMEPVHKVLRRFGYEYETEVLAEADGEIDGLVARLGHINRLRPTLNRPFEGEGESFDLIEQVNEFGEMVLFVENKRVRRVRACLERRSDAGYMRALLARVARRYARLDGNDGSRAEARDVHVGGSVGREAESISPPTSDDVLALVMRLRELRRRPA